MMFVRLSALAVLTATGGCAGVPPGLAPDPNERSIAVYVPASPGQAASVELTPAPDNSWRTPPPVMLSDLSDRIQTPLTPAGDEAAVFRRLINLLKASGPASSDELALHLGAPPIADMELRRASIERLSRSCGAVHGAAARPDIHPRLCPSAADRHLVWRLNLVGAGLSLGDVRADLEKAGYRELGETPTNPGLHPPQPGTESLLVRGEGDPIVAIAHLRRSTPSVTADSLFLLWPDRQGAPSR
jgi:hypothetical protein